jgi:hypothetical protein
VKGHGEPGFGPRVDEVVAACVSRVLGHTFVTPQRRVT